MKALTLLRLCYGREKAKGRAERTIHAYWNFKKI